MDPNDTHVEPAAEMLGEVSNPGALAAMDAALAGEPAPIPEPAVDPQPGDPLPPPDNEQRAPEGDGATDPDDNAPPSDTPKPDDKKTVEPTDPAKDDPAVEVPGQPQRPSDEFGELPADVPVKTRERFEAMKTSFDTVSAERDNYREQAQGWVDTVKSTGANPDQFGMTLEYLTCVNSGDPAQLERAYEMMMSEVAVLAKALNKEVPGIHDPLEGHPDLQQMVEDDVPREAVLEIAAARARTALSQQSQTNTQQATAQQAAQQAGLQAVTAFGASKKATDPQYAAKTAAIAPLVERVVAKLPPEEWAAAVKDLYDGAVVAAPVPTVDTPAPLRPTSVPGGDGIVKQPGSAREAVDMALASL